MADKTREDDNCQLFRHAGQVKYKFDCQRISFTDDDEANLPLSVWAKAIKNHLPSSEKEVGGYSEEIIEQEIIDKSQVSDDDHSKNWFQTF